MTASARDRGSRGGIFLLAGMLCVLSLAFLLERRASRANAEQLSKNLSLALRDLQQTDKVLTSRLGGIGSSLGRAQDRLTEQSSYLDQVTALLEEIAGEDTAPAVDVAIAPEEVGPPSLEEDCGFILSVEDLDRLPPLPEGLRARSFLADKRLAELVTQYRADPKRRLDGLETARALNILAEARARVEILQSRIRVATFESAEKLRERGDFVEYARGEKYYSERGVVSFGEDLGDAGTGSMISV